MHKSYWDIEYFKQKDGTCPVEEFIDGLDAKAKLKVFYDLRLISEQEIISKHKF